jgi:transposase
MAWLGEAVEEASKPSPTPRCVKDGGDGGESLGQHGYSKDLRPDLQQMTLGLVMDGARWPVCTEMWPGNTADVMVLLPIVDRVRQRFGIGRVCVVADRGMISAETIAGLEARGLDGRHGAKAPAGVHISL